MDPTQVGLLHHYIIYIYCWKLNRRKKEWTVHIYILKEPVLSSVFFYITEIAGFLRHSCAILLHKRTVDVAHQPEGDLEKAKLNCTPYVATNLVGSLTFLV